MGFGNLVMEMPVGLCVVAQTGWGCARGAGRGGEGWGFVLKEL